VAVPEAETSLCPAPGLRAAQHEHQVCIRFPAPAASGRRRLRTRRAALVRRRPGTRLRPRARRRRPQRRRAGVGKARPLPEARRIGISGLLLPSRPPAHAHPGHGNGRPQGRLRTPRRRLPRPPSGHEPSSGHWPARQSPAAVDAPPAPAGRRAADHWPARRTPARHPAAGQPLAMAEAEKAPSRNGTTGRRPRGRSRASTAASAPGTAAAVSRPRWSPAARTPAAAPADQQRAPLRTAAAEALQGRLDDPARPAVRRGSPPAEQDPAAQAAQGSERAAHAAAIQAEAPDHPGPAAIHLEQAHGKDHQSGTSPPAHPEAGTTG
jgi:hypothetical protein